MEWIQNKSTRSAILASEIVRHDVKNAQIFDWQNFIIMLSFYFEWPWTSVIIVPIDSKWSVSCLTSADSNFFHISMWGLFYLQAQHMRVKTEAQYGVLSVVTNITQLCSECHIFSSSDTSENRLGFEKVRADYNLGCFFWGGGKCSGLSATQVIEDCYHE